MRQLESQQRTELEGMREEKQRLQEVVRRQMEAIEALERQLRAASSNNSALQRQQQQLMSSVHTLIGLVSGGTAAHRSGEHAPSSAANTASSDAPGLRFIHESKYLTYL